MSNKKNDNESEFIEFGVTSSYSMCTVGDVVNRFISWNFEIYSRWWGIDYIANDTSTGPLHRCPVYADIRNSETLSVTLYKDASLDGNTNQYVYKNSSTYKFNGEDGQLPRLKMVGQYAEDKAYESDFSKAYTSKSLVRINDVFGIYVPKKITFRFTDFHLTATDGSAFTFGVTTFDLIEITEEENLPTFVNAYTLGSVQEYIFQTVEITHGIVVPAYVLFRLNRSYIEDYYKYISNSFTYTIIAGGKTAVTRRFEPGRDEFYVVDLLYGDIVVEISATMKSLNTVAVSSEEGQLNLHVCNDPTASSKTYKTALTYLETYGIVYTTYYDPSTLKSRVSIHDPAAYPKFEYLITYNYTDGSSKDSSGLFTYSTDADDDGYMYLPDISFKTVNSSIVDNVTLWLDAKEAYVPRTVTIVAYNTSIVYSVDSTTATLMEDSTNVYETVEAADNTIRFTCTSLPGSTSQQTIHGWYYVLSTSKTVKSTTYSAGTYVSIEVPKNMTIYLYVSTVATARILLDTDGVVAVYNNLTGEYLNAGYFYTTADSNNRSLNLTLISNSWYAAGSYRFGSKNTQNTLGAAKPLPSIVLETNDYFNLTLNKYTDNKLESTVSKIDGAEFGSGYNYKYTGLSTDSNVYYELYITGYDEYVNKEVTFNMNVADVSIGYASSNLEFDRRESYGGEYKFIYLMTSGTDFTVRIDVTAEDVNMYKTMIGEISMTDDDMLIPEEHDLGSMQFDSNGQYTLTVKGGTLSSAFDSMTEIAVDLTASVTVTYSYFVRSDGKAQISVYKDNWSDASALPLDSNDHIVYTTYTHPNEYKLRIECDDDDYKTYTYRVYDNSAVSDTIDSSTIELDRTTGYNDYYSYSNLFEDYGDGTTIYVSVDLDNILFWREVSKPLIVTWSADGSRMIPFREE